MILQILAWCGAFFIGFVVKGQMNHDFALRIEVNPCVIEITIGNTVIRCTDFCISAVFAIRMCLPVGFIADTESVLILQVLQDDNISPIHLFPLLQTDLSILKKLFYHPLR